MYNDPPGEHHRVRQAVVVTAPGVGREEVKRAVESYYALISSDICVLIVDDNTMIVVSSHSVRPQPLVDFILEQAGVRPSA